jgi:hypothetical protein
MEEQSLVAIIIGIGQISVTLGAIVAGFMVFISGQLRVMFSPNTEQERYRNEIFRPRLGMLQFASMWAVGILIGGTLFMSLATPLNLLPLEWIVRIGAGSLATGVFTIVPSLFWYIYQEIVLFKITKPMV